MKMLERLELENLNRKGKGLLLCSEAVISCQNLSSLTDGVTSLGHPVILGIPEGQIEPGLRGWAKARILGSVATAIVGVVGLNDDEFRTEAENQEWEGIKIVSPVIVEDRKLIIPSEGNISEELPVTDDPRVLEWMKYVKGLVITSNCWLDPAACVFIKGEKKLCEGVSTSYNGGNCKRIQLNFKELGLNPGERLMFCDSQHAEREGIARAARQGIKLIGSEAIMTKFPCRPCMQSLIKAGVSKVIYEVGSYGLADANLLVSNGVRIERVEID
jgi:deoxycytidylate deaminase